MPQDENGFELEDSVALDDNGFEIAESVSEPGPTIRGGEPSWRSPALVPPLQDIQAAQGEFVKSGATPLLPIPHISAPKRPFGETPAAIKAATGVANSLADTVSFFTSPLGIATLGIGALPKAVQRIIAGTFAAHMGSQMPEIASQLGTEVGKPESERDPEKIANLTTTAATQLGFATLAGKHALTPTPKALKLADEIQSAELQNVPSPDAAARAALALPPRPSPQALLPELERTRELVDRAIQEATQKIVVPGQTPALDLLRAQGRVVIPESIATAERIQGGGQAPYGKVSYMRGAEAPTTERTQNAQAIRSDPGQVREVGQEPEVVQDLSGQNLQQPAPGQPQPVVPQRPVGRGEAGETPAPVEITSTKKPSEPGTVAEAQNPRGMSAGEQPPPPPETAAPPPQPEPVRAVAEGKQNQQIDVAKPDLAVTDSPIIEKDFPKYNAEQFSVMHAGTDLSTGEPLYWVVRKVNSLKSAKPATPVAEGKQPWEMTREEWINKGIKDKSNEIAKLESKPKLSVTQKNRLKSLQQSEKTVSQDYAEGHRFQVEQALKLGNPVPETVLADYPDLQQPQPKGGVVREKAQGKEVPVKPSAPVTEAKAAPAKAAEGVRYEIKEDKGEFQAIAIIPKDMMPNRLGKHVWRMTEKTPEGDHIIKGQWYRTKEQAESSLVESLSAKHADISGSSYDARTADLASHEAKAEPIRAAIGEQVKQRKVEVLNRAITDRQASNHPAIWIDDQVITESGKYTVKDNGTLSKVQDLSVSGFEKNLMDIASSEGEGRWWGANKSAKERASKLIKDRDEKSAAEAHKKAEEQRVKVAQLAEQDAYNSEWRALDLPKGKKQSVQIPVQNVTTGKPEGFKSEEMTVHGSLGIRKNSSGSEKSGYKYFVTHVPTGLSLGNDLKISTLKQAQDFIKAIIHTGVDLSKKTFTNEETKALLQARDAMWKEGAGVPEFWKKRQSKPTPPTEPTATAVKPTERSAAEMTPAERALPAGQKKMAYEAASVSVVDSLNRAVRKKAPDKAWSDKAIQDATGNQAMLDSIRDDLLPIYNELYKKTTEPTATGKGALDTAIKNIEDLQKRIRGTGENLGMNVPRALLDTALEVARLTLKAGKTVAEAIEAAIAHIRKNASAEVKQSFNEAQVRANLESALSTPRAETQPTPTAAAPAKPGKPAAATGETLADVYKIFEPLKKKRPAIGQIASQLSESVRTGLASRFRPIDKLAEDIAKEYGIKTPRGIAGIFEQIKGASGKAEADIYRFDQEVSKLLRGSEKDFNAYMFLRRSLDRLLQDQADIQTAMAGGTVKKLNRRAVSDYTIPQLESKLAKLSSDLGPAKMAEFAKAAEGYQRHMDAALKLQVDSGRMSPEVYAAIKEGNQFYAPFKVMKYLQDTALPEGSGRKVDTLADYTKAMEGISDKDLRLGDMLGAARQNIMLSRILAEKNRAMLNISNLAAFDTSGKFIRKLKPMENVPLDMETVNVFEAGRPVKYVVNKDVAAALQIYGQNAQNVILRLMGAMAVPFRAGATALNVPFQISNLLADQPRAALVSKYGIQGAMDLIRYPLDFSHALFSSIKGDMFGSKNQLFLDFLDSGVAGSTIQETLTPKSLNVKPYSMARTVGRNVLWAIPDFAKAIEQTSKIMGVKRAMRFEGVSSGRELAAKIPQAVTELRRFSGSPDFGRQGKWTEQARLNILYMFFNARLQGTTADVGRLIGRDGAATAAKTWLKLGTAVGVPTVYLYLLNQDEKYADDYAKRPTQEKQNYWLIPKDSFITSPDGEKIRDYWRIPKRESSKWIANMAESSLDFARKRDPESFGNFAQAMMEDISPVNIQGKTFQERLESTATSLNPLVKAPIELASGRDMYRHRAVVPDAMKKASPEQQYTDRTAEVFKNLANEMPDVAPEVFRSPLMLENLTKNLTAGLFTQFLPRKPVEGRTKLENSPMLQRFQSLPVADREEFDKEMASLEREAADAQLARHRTAIKLMDENKGKSLKQIAAMANGDVKLINHLVDLYVAKERGITGEERQLLGLPAAQRASYIAKRINGATPEKKQALIKDFAAKRILTEAVAVELEPMLTK